MNIGDLRAAIKDLPDDVEVRHVYWMGTCDLSIPAYKAKLVSDPDDTEAFAVEIGSVLPFLEIS